MASAPLTAIRRASEAALARELGVSRQAIHDLVKRGILTKSADGTIDVELATHAIRERLHPGSKTAAAVSPAPKAQPDDVPAESKAPKESANEQSFHVARTLREAAEAQIARMKLAQMRRELMPVSDATKAAHYMGSYIRDQLTASRRRMSPYLAASTSVTECEEILRKDHQQMLDAMVEHVREQIQLGNQLPRIEA